MMIAWAIFRNSLPLQLVTIALLGWGYLAANNAYQRHVGASQVAAKVEKKADDNAKTANAVRDTVATGAGRVRNPYRRPGE